MKIINSSIVLVANRNQVFKNNDCDGVVQKIYSNNIHFSFTPPKLIFHVNVNPVNVNSDFLSDLEKQTSQYCQKSLAPQTVQEIGINFLIAKENIEYKILSKTWSNKLFKESVVKFKDQSPTFSDINLQYIVKEEIFNIKIQKAHEIQKIKDQQKIPKTIPFFDININRTFNNSNIEDIQNFIKSLKTKYNEIKQFIEEI